ncbi:transmembrane protein [Cystoisospora suis]|uniref:Transmembrane protein n=1 Tax=Cystoisospora suis TaxID=483139 RepID=A0A2C6KMJ4_9APIC|nr:transmembrane protein [Cystoisospora suis]
MLQANKASVLTNFHVGSVNVQYMEVEYFMMVFNKITSLASLLSGFAASAFLQSTGLTNTGYSWLKLLHVICTSSALGFMLLVLVISTLCTMWAPGLALRGSTDSSLRKAVDVMHSSVNATFRLFSIGLGCYLCSSILSMILLQPTPSCIISVGIISTGAVYILRAGLQVIDALSPGFTTYAPIQGDPLVNGYFPGDQDGRVRAPFVFTPPEASPYIQVCGVETNCRYYESQTGFSLAQQRAERQGIAYIFSQIFPFSQRAREATLTPLLSPPVNLSAPDEGSSTLRGLDYEGGQGSMGNPGIATAVRQPPQSPGPGKNSEALSSSEGRRRTDTDDGEEAERTQGESEYRSPMGTRLHREESSHGAVRSSYRSGSDDQGNSCTWRASGEEDSGYCRALSTHRVCGSRMPFASGKTETIQNNRNAFSAREQGKSCPCSDATSENGELGGSAQASRQEGRFGCIDSSVEPPVDNSKEDKRQPFARNGWSLFQSSDVFDEPNFRCSSGTDEERRGKVLGTFSQDGPEQAEGDNSSNHGIFERGMQALVGWLLPLEDFGADKESTEAPPKVFDTQRNASTANSAQCFSDTTHTHASLDSVYRRRGVFSTGLGQERERKKENSSGSVSSKDSKGEMHDTGHARRHGSAFEHDTSLRARDIQREELGYGVDLLEEEELFLGTHQLADSG